MSSKQQEKASRLRQQVRSVWDQMDADLERLVSYRSLLKGSIYRWEHKCGRQGCHCAKGELHVHWVLSYYDRTGKLVKLYLTEEEHALLDGPAKAHKEYRDIRARLVKRHAELMALLDKLEKAVQVKPPKRRKRNR